MDQNADSNNPIPTAPTAPVSGAQDSSAPISDDLVTNPAAAFAPTVSPIESAENVPKSTAPTDTAPISDPTTPTDTTATPEPATIDDGLKDASITEKVIKKISESQNVLVALSSDPSVDEMAAAIGLSLFLDKLGKRATAIYSGSTPNALEFLKPEETFEPTVDTLQDFVVALNKEKADHLRYKLDGDYVKIFITPYKTRISEEDLEFSYGDFNVDLVISLNVSNGIDLDTALREHGRIMHDAVIINITTENPGNFGEIEWSDKNASSISEMIAELLYNVDSNAKIEKDEATAFLTGIIAATDRFSNTKTTPETMQISSKLMQSGADQQLITKNITQDVDNKLYSLLGNNDFDNDKDPTKLDIKHNEKEEESEGESKDEAEDKESSSENAKLLDDLKNTEADLAQISNEISSDIKGESSNTGNPIKDNIESTDGISNADPSIPPLNPSNLDEVPTLSPESKGPSTERPEGFLNPPDNTVQPSPEIGTNTPEEGYEKYGKMLQDAISDSGEPSAPNEPTNMVDNPAFATTPQVPSAPQINGVPEINYMPMPGEEVLPPPPTPPIDTAFPTPTTTEAQPSMMETPQPTVEPTMPSLPPTESPTENPIPSESQSSFPGEPIPTAQPAEPSAFKIPGM